MAGLEEQPGFAFLLWQDTKGCLFLAKKMQGWSTLRMFAGIFLLKSVSDDNLSLNYS